MIFVTFIGVTIKKGAIKKLTLIGRTISWGNKG